MSDAPTCCGRPMSRSGSQYVCKKCKSWVQPGVITHHPGDSDPNPDEVLRRVLAREGRTR
ncbi:hypothetical protein GCM10010387_16070 [Streptomyces inusitatus]|uniref:Uncharacterized protein n=1 Tax=Streptomyces inusitatus TaxID=68221 RepID=A0A918PX37_9ACTN|nr:hypothetical protein [Streptomyces inusitatus]GGZ23661.1 hypothetical protein GCM10010387_16070 [Streptomyces inusitatus]